VQCLYCEAELKNFRGLFDEDFCSREHREKYLASFRKALTQLPDAVSPVAPEVLFSEATTPAASSQETVQTVTVSNVASEAAIEASQPPPSVEADFLKTTLAAVSSSFSPGAIPNFSFAVCNALTIPGTPTNWCAAPELESGMADFVEAVPTPSAAARFSPADAAHSGTISLEPAEVAFDETQATAEVISRQQVAPVTSAAIKPVVPFFSVAAETKSLPIADAIDPTFYALQLVSAPACAAELPLAHEGFFPAFTASCAAMSEDEQPESDSHTPSEIAPALVWIASPVTSTFSSPARSPEMMPPAFGIASARPVAAPAQFNVPGLSLNAPRQPDAVADISMPHQKPANSAAQPHAHEPLRPTFGSSVRIKNWRVRINFAKPA
jgi:hypothetical protein